MNLRKGYQKLFSDMILTNEGQRKASEATKVAAEGTGGLFYVQMTRGGANNEGWIQKSCTDNFNTVSGMLKSKTKTITKVFMYTGLKEK